MKGGHNSKPQKLKYHNRVDAIRSACVASASSLGLDRAHALRRARRYIRESKSIQEVRELLNVQAVKLSGPDFVIPQSVHAMRFSGEIFFALREAQRIQSSYNLISDPKTRRKLSRVLESGASSEEDLLLCLEAEGIYPLVKRDLNYLHFGNSFPYDIEDYMRSGAWLKKFKGTTGGPTRQVPAAYCATRLAYWCQQFQLRSFWGYVAEIVDRNFSALWIPTAKNGNNSKVNYKRRRWVKLLVKRYCRWAAAFRPSL